MCWQRWVKPRSTGGIGTGRGSSLGRKMSSLRCCNWRRRHVVRSPLRRPLGRPLRRTEYVSVFSHGLRYQKFQKVWMAALERKRPTLSTVAERNGKKLKCDILLPHKVCQYRLSALKMGRITTRMSTKRLYSIQRNPRTARASHRRVRRKEQY